MNTDKKDTKNDFVLSVFIRVYPWPAILSSL